MSQDNISPAYRLVEVVYENSNLSRRKSKQSMVRFNSALFDAVNLCIRGEVRFGEEDFEKFERDFHMNRWIGAEGFENWYTLACEENNSNAFRTLESYKGREPFFVLERSVRMNSPPVKNRVYVGSQIYLPGIEQRGRIICTSIHDKPEVDIPNIVACYYDYNLPENQRSRPTKRYTLTHADLEEQNEELERRFELDRKRR